MAKNKLRLLYIEDEKEIRDTYFEYLETQFREVEVAVDGEEGYRKYQAFKPDIIVTDIMMPKIDGLELVKKIRTIDCETQIIVTTAVNDNSMLLQAVGLNMADYVIKPFTIEKLNIALDKAKARIKNQPAQIKLSADIYWDNTTAKLYDGKNQIHLTKHEKYLMVILARNLNLEVDVFDIFDYIWPDYEKGYDPNKIRTLVKKVKDKLPKGALQNVYGGKYMLQNF